MGKPKAPKPPNPQQTSEAQTGTSVATSVANTMLGNVNQVGPNGSLNYSQTGTHKFTDPYTGKTYDIPTFTATTSLAPELQRLRDIGVGTQRNLGNVAQGLSGTLGEFLSRDNMSLDGLDFSAQPELSADKALRSRYENALMSRINPQLERDRAAAESRLANQGIGAGSRAYSATQRDLGQSANDARVAAILRGGDEQARDLQSRQGAQAHNMQMRQGNMQMRQSARGSRINEIAALLGGSQVQMPNFQINQPSQIATTDNAGLINANYGQQQKKYESDLASWNDLWGGLFDFGKSAIGGGA